MSLFHSAKSLAIYAEISNKLNNLPPYEILRHGSIEVDSFLHGLSQNCQAKLTFFEPCLKRKNRCILCIKKGKLIRTTTSDVDVFQGIAESNHAAADISFYQWY